MELWLRWYLMAFGVLGAKQMDLDGGCHCGNLRVRLRVTRPPQEQLLRSCSCSFCRAHGTRTASDPDGLFEVWAEDWSLVAPYRFGSRTADYLICRQCGVYIGAVCETSVGLRAVANINFLSDRVDFSQDAVHPDHEGEPIAERLARRAANWMPALLHR
jgi:hypothetical protein